MPTPTSQPTWMDNTWNMLSSLPLIGDIMDLVLYRAIQKEHPQAVRDWLRRRKIDSKRPRQREWGNTLFRSAVAKLEAAPNASNRDIVLALIGGGLCQVPSSDKEELLITLSSKREWDVLFKLARDQKVSSRQATIAFSIFMGYLDGREDDVMAKTWLDEFRPDPLAEERFASNLHKEPYADPKDEPIACVWDYALRHGDNNMLSSLLDEIAILPSELCSGIASRKRPLSAEVVLKMERSHVAWQDVLLRLMPDEKPMDRARVLFHMKPGLAELIEQGRDMARSELEQEQLDHDTSEAANTSQSLAAPSTGRRL